MEVKTLPSVQLLLNPSPVRFMPQLTKTPTLNPSRLLPVFSLELAALHLQTGAAVCLALTFVVPQISPCIISPNIRVFPLNQRCADHLEASLLLIGSSLPGLQEYLSV